MADEFELKFDLSNAAFAEPSDRVDEIRRILESVSSMICAGRTDGVVMDRNGNKVGVWSFDEIEQEECSMCGETIPVHEAHECPASEEETV